MKVALFLKVSICLVTLLTIDAHSQTKVDMSVLGMSLGERFSVAECERSKMFYERPRTGICFERPNANYDAFKRWKKSPPPPVDNQSVLIQISDLPIFLYGGNVYAGIVDGIIESFHINTAGIKAADLIQKALQAKYGEPRSISTRKVQNRFGATFDAISAKWLFPNLIVGFESVLASLDAGVVIIATEKGLKWKNEEAKKQPTIGRPL